MEQKNRTEKNTLDCDLDGADSASCIVYEGFKSSYVTSL